MFRWTTGTSDLQVAQDDKQVPSSIENGLADHLNLVNHRSTCPQTPQHLHAWHNPSSHTTSKPHLTKHIVLTGNNLKVLRYAFINLCCHNF